MHLFKRWQDLAWLAVLLVLSYLAYRIIPAIDPRSGIDGFGDLFNALVMGVKGVGATILAWLCKQLYWWEPDTTIDRRWHDLMEHGYYPEDDIGAVPPTPNRESQKWAMRLIIMDRLEYLAWLAIWLFVFF